MIRYRTTIIAILFKKNYKYSTIYIHTGVPFEFNIPIISK